MKHTTAPRRYKLTCELEGHDILTSVMGAINEVAKNLQVTEIVNPPVQQVTLGKISAPIHAFKEPKETKIHNLGGLQLEAAKAIEAAVNSNPNKEFHYTEFWPILEQLGLNPTGTSPLLSLMVGHNKISRANHRGFYQAATNSDNS